MSNSTDKTSCISHRANSRFFVMYEDFLEVAKVSEHQYKLAAFWRILETKTNDRITYNEERIESAKKQNLPLPETDLWIEIPYSECVNRSLGIYKSSSFQVAAAESERLGFSKSRVRKRPVNPLDQKSPLEDYKEYLFLTPVMQSILNGGEYPTPIEINSPLLKSIPLRKERRKAKRAIENNTPGIEINSPPVEINTTAIENNRKKNSEESVKDEKNYEREDTRTQSVTSATSSSPGNDTTSSTDEIGTVTGVSYSQEDTRNSIAQDVVTLMGVRETIDTLTEEVDKHISDKHPALAQRLYENTQEESRNIEPNGYEKTTPVETPSEVESQDDAVKHSAPPPQAEQTSRASGDNMRQTTATRAGGDGINASTSREMLPGHSTGEAVQRQHTGEASRDSTTLPVSHNKTVQTSGNKNAGKGKTSQTEKPQLTLRGQQVHEWMEELQETRIRRTAGNVTACNDLGENEDITQESLGLTYKLLINLSWVKEHDYPIDVQVLANEKSKLNFERNWPVAKRRKRHTNGHSPTANGMQGLSTPVDNDTVARSAFDVYVGNGPEERAALHAQVEALRAQGLISMEELN